MNTQICHNIGRQYRKVLPVEQAASSKEQIIKIDYNRLSLVAGAVIFVCQSAKTNWRLHRSQVSTEMFHLSS